MSIKKNSPAAYPDVKYIMELALERPGLKYVLQTAGKATHFKQRCYAYRNLIRSQLQEQVVNIPGYRAETAFDALVIRQVNEKGESKKPDSRILIFDHISPEGQLIDPETGKEIEIKLNIPVIDR